MYKVQKLRKSAKDTQTSNGSHALSMGSPMCCLIWEGLKGIGGSSGPSWPLYRSKDGLQVTAAPSHGKIREIRSGEFSVFALPQKGVPRAKALRWTSRKVSRQLKSLRAGRFWTWEKSVETQGMCPSMGILSGPNCPMVA